MTAATVVRSVGDVTVVPPSRWDEVVAELGGRDTYLLAAYHDASAALEPPGTHPVLLRVRTAGGDLALPLLLRPLPGGGGWDATTPYGYGGPVSPRPVPGWGAELDRWARANGVVTTFLRLHPLLENTHLVPPAADLVELGSTVAWDVSRGRDLRQHMHPHHRRAARKAERAGLELAVRTAPGPLEEFRKLYETTMRRQEAAPFFFFPDDYWTRLQEHEADLGTVLVEGRLDGELVASLLCFTHGPWLHYHLGGSADIARTIGASNACFLAGAEWAQAHGFTGFHLGGGVGGRSESSLFVFKRRFEPEGALRTFHVAKLVHDPDRYRELSGTASTDGFFPPWRASANTPRPAGDDRERNRSAIPTTPLRSASCAG